MEPPFQPTINKLLITSSISISLLDSIHSAKNKSETSINGKFSFRFCCKDSKKVRPALHLCHQWYHSSLLDGMIFTDIFPKTLFKVRHCAVYLRFQKSRSNYLHRMQSIHRLPDTLDCRGFKGKLFLP